MFIDCGLYIITKGVSFFLVIGVLWNNSMKKDEGIELKKDCVK